MTSVQAVESRRAYHQRELEIARTPTDPGHISPPAVAPGRAVLDIGCGAGQTLITAYEGRRGFGLDIDFESLRLGKEWGCNAPFVCARAEFLPFNNGSFDLVVARSSLQYTDLRKSLPEIRRVLKEGGQVWMVMDSLGAFWSVPRGWRPKAWLHFCYVAINSIVFRVSGRQIALFGRYETIQTRRGLTAALARAGFLQVQVQLLVRKWQASGPSQEGRSRNCPLWVANAMVSCDE